MAGEAGAGVKLLSNPGDSRVAGSAIEHLGFSGELTGGGQG